MFAAILDTCVLWPSMQRDFLLSLAAQGVYRPLWSRQILEELEEAERAKLAERGVEQSEAESRAGHLLTKMTTHFADAVVVVNERVRLPGLPDPDDEHVAVAAVVGGAGAIVTHNTKDFPPHLLPNSILVLTPRQFSHEMVVAEPQLSLEALHEMSRRRIKPVVSPEDLVDLMVLRYGMTEAGAILKDLLRSAGSRASEEWAE